ncbi:MAG: hypothetical protein L6416_07705 [Candidatus Omnitrophica bacterium]|nr:hypothetical protein [Candidatus Omnitrophota bacterium]
MRNLKIKFIFIICLCVSTSVGLLSASPGFAQQGSAQSVEVSGYSFNTNTANMPAVAYGVLVSPRFNDENNAARFLDPSGQSVLESLRVFDGINLDVDSSDTGTPFLLRHITSPHFINFNDTGTDDGYARFHYLRAYKFHMEDDGPLNDWDAQRGGGKLVYDIAEAVLAAEGEPGDVVVISSDEDITLVKSKKKFDTKVAGVISADPRIYMGYSPEAEKAGRYKPLALAGVVLCNVSAENGAIKKGDILVSSSLPGHAMRADPEQLTPGMMLGSALGSLGQGEGKIYILVN